MRRPRRDSYATSQINSAGKLQPDRPLGKCPICGRAHRAQYRPFCSRRCADVDLSRWLRGAYAIPTRPDDDEDGESPGADREPQERRPRPASALSVMPAQA